MMRISVIGMGPGHPDYILPVALRTARQCDVLVGAPRFLELFVETNSEKIVLTGDLHTLVEQIKNRYIGRQVGFLVSGDPGIHSLLNFLKTNWTTAEIEVIPGISSIQYLFGRIKQPWQDCSIISLHGRYDNDLLAKVRENRLIAILTDPKNTPAAIASYLIQNGVSNKKVYVGCSLSWPDERIFCGDLDYISRLDINQMCLVVIENDE